MGWREEGPGRRSRWWVNATWLLALGMLSGCTSVGPEIPERPSVLLITLDTTRADHLATYGYPRKTTPTLDAQAARSIVFDRFLVPMATTLPTHTSLLTGVHPLEHGVVANVKHGGQSFAASEELVPFTALAKAAGYSTAAFVSATPLKAGTGIEEAFDTFDEAKGPSRAAGRTTDVARAWLKRKRRARKPFFAWVHYFDPHAPLEPPPPYDTWFERRDGIDRWLADRQIERSERRSGLALEPLETANLYDGELRYVDDQIARLLDTGREVGWAEHTVVIVVGDHGEGLGQHGQSGHGVTWGEQLHAPFWISSPWHAPRRIDTPTTAQDVFPTLLGLVDIPGEERFLEQASGVDVLAEPSGRPILHLASSHQAALGAQAETALTVGQWRYHRSHDGAEMLFALAADPHEQKDVVEAFPLQARVLRDLEKGIAAERAARGSVLGTVREVSLDPERIEQLEALGYVQ